MKDKVEILEDPSLMKTLAGGFADLYDKQPIFPVRHLIEYLKN